MNIEPDIFDYLQTTSLEPHDDYTSEITYKDQKIIWKRLQEQDKEIERLNNIIKELTQENLKRSDKIDELLEIKNKAIEYIEEKGRLKYKPDELINILQGSDKDV